MNNNDNNLDIVLLKRTINYLINKDKNLKGIIVEYFKEEIEHLKECSTDIVNNNLFMELKNDDLNEINKYRAIINKMNKIIDELENKGEFYE